MATFESTAIDDGKPIVTPQSAGEVMVQYGEATLTDALAANDLIVLGVLPADCMLVDLIFTSDDLDSDGTPAIVMDVGILNAAEDDLETNQTIISATDVGQAGGVVRGNIKNMYDRTYIDVSTSDRKIAAKVTTVAATPAAGKVRASILYRAAEYRM